MHAAIPLIASAALVIAILVGIWRKSFVFPTLGLAAVLVTAMWPKIVAGLGPKLAALALPGEVSWWPHLLGAGILLALVLLLAAVARSMTRAVGEFDRLFGEGASATPPAAPAEQPSQGPVPV